MEIKVGYFEPSARKPERFNTTRWSLVAAAQNGTAGGTREALIQLCLHYWYPVYAYIRHSGHSPQLAQDIARAFFDDLIGHRLSDYIATTGDQFRDFLLAALNRFLVQDWRSDRVADGASSLAPPHSLEELEARHQAHAPVVDTPEQAYQRGYALALMSCALNRLRQEARQAGRIDLFEALEPFLTQDAAPGQYEEVAKRLEMRAMGVVMAAKRLRQRFRELVEDELTETVGSPAALDAERDALRQVLL